MSLTLNLTEDEVRDETDLAELVIEDAPVFVPYDGINAICDQIVVTVPSIPIKP